MGIYALKCPECHGNIELDDSRDFGFCQFCGTKIQIERSISGKVCIDKTEDIKQWLQLAKSAYKNNVFNECERYAKMVTDVDCTQPEAWYFRAMCSTNLEESNFCYDRLITLSGRESQLALECQERIRSFMSRPMRLRIIFPPKPIKASGSFSYFGTKLDGADQQIAHLNGSLEIDTISGIHEIEIRQINLGIFSGSTTRYSEEIEIREGDVLRVMVESNKFVFNIVRKCNYGNPVLN